MLSKPLPAAPFLAVIAASAALVGFACRSAPTAGQPDARVAAPSASPAAAAAPSLSVREPPPELLHSAAPTEAAPELPAAIETASPPVSDRLHVLVVGDSLSDPRVGGGAYLKSLLAGCPSARFDNRARGGFMVNQMRRRFEAEVAPSLPGPYTHLLVFGGVNDLYSDETAGRSVAKIQADLTALYARGKAAGLRVVAVTVAPWGGFSRYFTARRAGTTRTLNAWIVNQQREGRVDAVVDAHAVLACADPDRLCPQHEPPFKDGLHFGPAGHQALGAALVSQAFPECATPNR